MSRSSTEQYRLGVPRLAAIRLSSWVLLATASAGWGQMQAPDFVRADAVWGGEVRISGDVTIAGAEVRVLAGTTIRFAAGTGPRGPVIRLASPLFAAGERSRPARLVLDGTPDRPIVVETVAGAAPGSIESVIGTTAALNARSVIFRRLGSQADRNTTKPAISLELDAPDNDAWLTDCEFEDCGPVWVDLLGPEASAEVRGCSFARTRGPVALSLGGPGAGVKVVQDNVLDAGLEVTCPQALVRGNVLVGEAAALIVRRTAKEAVTISGNYVHCTTARDIGRYAVRCETPAARLLENVLVGGSYVVETPPALLSGNVLIGAGSLEGQISVTRGSAGGQNVPGFQTMTHTLVANVPPSAAITGNLFLGPAYAAMSVGAAAGSRIEGNVFDGWGVARRALQFEPAPGGHGKVAFANNVVTGYTRPPIVAEAKGTGIELQAAGNSFVGLSGPVYEGIAGIADLAPGDRRVETLGHLAARGSPATQAAADVDELLTTRRKTVADVRKTWFELYGVVRK